MSIHSSSVARRSSSRRRVSASANGAGGAPQRVDQEIAGHDVPGAEKQDGQDAALLRTAERQLLAVVGQHFERPERAKVGHTQVVAGTTAACEPPLGGRECVVRERFGPGRTVET
jgi:hypothetical protein